MEDKYLEKTMERLNSGELKTIFRNISCIVIIGLTTSGRKHGQRRRKQEKIPVLYWFIRSNLVPPSSSRPFRTQFHWSYYTGQCCYFRAASSNTFIMSDVQSVYIPSSIRDWYLEVKIWATDRQYSFCLSIPWTKIIRNLIRSTWMNRDMHNTCIKHGRNIRIRKIGSKSILLWRNGWSSIKHDRTLSFFTKHFQLIVFRKLFGWKLERSYMRKYMRHLVLLPRSPWNMTGWKNWVQKLFNDQMDKLFNNLEVPNQTNQIQTRIMMIERGNPLFAVTQVTRNVQEKRPVLRRSKHVLFMKKLLNMIERGHPLFAVTQVTRKVTSNQCWTRWTLTPEYLDCHILLWNKLRTLLFVNWSRRSRTTLTDNFFNEIYNKTKPTTCSVRRQRKWFRTWATWSCLNCSRRTPRRSAKNAYHVGVKASSIAHAGISKKEIAANRGFIELHWSFSQFQST